MFKKYLTKLSISLTYVQMHWMLSQEMESGPDISLTETFPLKIYTIFHNKISIIQEIYS